MQKKYNLTVAISLVMSSMVGVGIFTSLGYQVLEIKSIFALMFSWFIGGVIALTGALAYAEISTILKRSGGEYHYLTEIYHPSIGFTSGIISLVVGFAAPICAISLAIGAYLSPFLGDIQSKMVAACILLVTTIFHLLGIKMSGPFQNITTLYKILFIILFCAFGFLSPVNSSHLSALIPTSKDLSYVFTSTFAISLVYVNFSYSGWNASTYVAGSVENPSKNLPRSLILGTIVVTFFYMLLNYMFLGVVNLDELAGKTDVGQLVALKLWGNSGAKIISALISLSLISTLSALIIAGPKVAETIGEDYPLFKKLAKKNRFGAAYIAILLQVILALIMLTGSSFQYVIQYIGITLSFFSVLTVIGVFVLRIKKPDLKRSFKTWGYPIVPLIFIIINLAMILFLAINNHILAFYSLMTILVGFLFYYFMTWLQAR